MAENNRIKKLFGEVRAEFRRITWANWDQFKKSAIIVLSVCGFFAVYVGVVDAIYSKIQSLIFK
ncbi:MAG: preprotein translocase subunit SecE [Oscillospiraceae bacterium]|nr:preprotein translocase subunit SecE [Oscillospiraceae bacterium]